jgi:type I restriction enzyme S subunit
MKRISKSLSEEYRRTVLRGGEVLVNVRGTLGGVATVSEAMAGWNVSREIAVVPADPAKVSAKFLSFLIASEKSQKWLTSVEKGVAYTGINLVDLRSLPIELPALEEQHEIVRRVEALFAIADKVQTRFECAVEHLDTLAPALLAKAFRGELVPQDPNDEPAEKLLERLSAQADTPAATGKRVKRSTKPTATVG